MSLHIFIIYYTFLITYLSFTYLKYKLYNRNVFKFIKMLFFRLNKSKSLGNFSDGYFPTSLNHIRYNLRRTRNIYGCTV